MNDQRGLARRDAATAASKIREHFPHARVFLFGSAARGTDDAGSDLDLCVVLDVGSRREIEIAREISRELHTLVRRPLDVVVYDEAAFDERAALPLTLESEVAEEGVVL